tara:strand:+ start:195 stop:551 length:357 start_codon:yes stop_codon:yes gene_type:complete
MELKINKIHDSRNIGKLDDGFPFSIWIECNSEDGAEYKGWYHPTDEWKTFIPKNRKSPIYDKGYNFHQSKLVSGKTCSRKVSAKITTILINLIKKNLSSVTDHGIIWNKIQNDKIKSA